MKKEENQNLEKLNSNTPEKVQENNLDIKPMNDLDVKIEPQKPLITKIVENKQNKPILESFKNENIESEETVINLDNELSNKDQDLHSLEEDGLIKVIKKEIPKKEEVLLEQKTNENPKKEINNKKHIKTGLQEELNSIILPIEKKGDLVDTKKESIPTITKNISLEKIISPEVSQEKQKEGENKEEKIIKETEIILNGNEEPIFETAIDSSEPTIIGSNNEIDPLLMNNKKEEVFSEKNVSKEVLQENPINKENNLVSNPLEVELVNNNNQPQNPIEKKIDPLKEEGEEKVEAPELTTEEIKKDNPIAIRTYRGDLAKVIKNDKISLTEAIIAEETKKENGKDKNSNKIKKIDKPTRKKIYLSILSMFLVLSGIISVIFVYYYKPTPIIKVNDVEVKSFIYSEYQKEIFIENLNNIKLTKLIQTSIDNINLPIGSLLHLYLTKRYEENNLVGKSIMSTNELFSLLNSRASETLLRFLEPNFMFGYYSSNENYPFLILKTTSFDNSFPEMLVWENNIVEDLKPLFTENKPTISNEDIRGGEFKFKDIVIKNKDTRAILNDSGEIIFAYSFIDKNTIIITTSKISLQEVFDRLTISYRER
ncbi:hypothetical protein KJ603_00690 [Patescibacteria group bacterium]|nr:hypothetical protein [Patescibacteria group bacterium]